ncbi:MAG TPA: hypothetical protein VJM34_00600 [Novosphingobium sp.]|nr:hypothetical protein [Novosphingobium sp.]
MSASKRLSATILLAMAGAGLAGCAGKGEIVVDEGVGITAIRSRCPAVGIPDYTGDTTLFTAPGARTAADIDAVAAMTNVRSRCTETASQVIATASFDVLARRTNTSGPRQLALPYFVTVLQGGNTVATKRVGTVTINFADGQERAQASAEGSAFIDLAAATLPAEIRQRITRRRRAGDADAAVDPLADPEVKAAISRSNFELLVGFQLNEDQLKYNATR